MVGEDTVGDTVEEDMVENMVEVRGTVLPRHLDLGMVDTGKVHLVMKEDTRRVDMAEEDMVEVTRAATDPPSSPCYANIIFPFPVMQNCNFS